MRFDFPLRGSADLPTPDISMDGEKKNTRISFLFTSAFFFPAAWHTQANSPTSSSRKPGVLLWPSHKHQKKSKGPCSKQTNGHLGQETSSGCFCPTLSLPCIRPHRLPLSGMDWIELPLNVIDKNLLLERGGGTGQQLETGKNDQNILSMAEAAVSWSRDIL